MGDFSIDKYSKKTNFPPAAGGADDLCALARDSAGGGRRFCRDGRRPGSGLYIRCRRRAVVKNPGNYTASMAEGVEQTTDRIVVEGGTAEAPVNLTLDGVNISSNACALEVKDFSSSYLNLTLVGANTLSSGNNCPGIRCQQGATLTIGGDGQLTATGGSNAAGIGGGDGGGGTITIEGGTVEATGGQFAAGIGGGVAGDSGTIIIIIGGSVKANSGGGLAEAIGCGAGGADSSLTNSSGANVYLTTVTLVRMGVPISAGALVSSLTASVDYAYGVDDVVTDSDGKLYLYLPAGTEITETQAADSLPPHTIRKYKGRIETNSSHTAAGSLIVQLAAPAGLAWEGATPGKATWDAVASASSYTVQLYKNGAAQGGAVTGVTDTEYDFTSDIVTAGTGVYTFTVIAAGDGVNYTDSDPSDESAVYSYTPIVIDDGGGERLNRHRQHRPITPLFKQEAVKGQRLGFRLTRMPEPRVDAGSLGFDKDGTVIKMPSTSPVLTLYCWYAGSGTVNESEIRGTLTLDTDVGNVTVPSNMLTGVPGISGSKAEITIGKGDKDNLSAAVKAAIGDRPLIRLTLSIDGKQTNWSNPDAPVTVSIPYTPDRGGIGQSRKHRYLVH